MNKQKAIALIREVSNYMATRPEIDEAVDMAIEALSTERTGWIPVSERLPETVSHNIVSNGDMTWVALWQENDWYGVGFPAAKLYDVIAWMPLPEPYKGGDTE